jgi:hypothetical protein
MVLIGLRVAGTQNPALGELPTHYLGSFYTVAAMDGVTRDHLARTLPKLVPDSADCVMCMVGDPRSWCWAQLLSNQAK